MSYETTEVPVSRSQEGIRKLILSRNGGKVAFVSDPPKEGFEAIVEIDGNPYKIRIAGECRTAPEQKWRKTRGGHTIAKETTDKSKRDFSEKEERRIWRVLYYHMKAVFESADSGVMELRELMLPYLVTANGETIAEQIVPKLAQAMQGNSARLLGSGR